MFNSFQGGSQYFHIDYQLCVIGRSGLESIVDVNLTAKEQATFDKSAAAVRNMNAALDSILS